MREFGADFTMGHHDRLPAALAGQALAGQTRCRGNGNALLETDSRNSTVARYTPAPELYGSPVSQRRGGATSFGHYKALRSASVEC